MQCEIYTVFDVKAGVYLPPFFMHNEPMAVRQFSNMVTDPNHAFGKNPGDYTLFYLGTYDDSDATITPVPSQAICNGIEIAAHAQIDNGPPVLTGPPGADPQEPVQPLARA